MPGKIEFFKAADTLARFLKEKVCLAESSGTPCEGAIISAHTVARSQLEKIAVDGHVKAFNISAAQLDRSDGHIGVKDFGINQFSTLNCFCEKHDASIFSDVENIPLGFTPQQLAVLHYRAVASELYRKTQTHKGTLKQLEFFRKEAGRAARDKVAYLKATSAGENQAVEDMTTALNNASKVLDNGQYSSLAAMVARFRAPPSIMTVSAFFPEVDFEGKRLSKLGDPKRVYEIVSVHILAAADGNAAIAFVWNKSDAIAVAFVESYLRQRPVLYTTLAIQFTFECFENMCMAPTWWNGLKKVEQDLLIARMMSFGQSGNNYLEFSGVAHDNWDFSSSAYVEMLDAPASVS
jgi:hypothetical protein